MRPMHRLVRGTALAAAALLVTAGGAFAQGPVPLPGAQQQQVPDSIRTMLMEVQMLQQRLGSIQQQALETDTALQHQQETLQERIEAAMKETDPQVAAATERMQALEQEAAAAQAAQDTAALMTLVQEAQQLQGRLEAAQEAVMEKPEVAGAMDAFRADLLVAMKKVEPETDALIERFESLVQKLQAASGGE
ncbi:MAG TPA: hypothetical protein VMK65_04660 [Longimicrobiales bacterium]|nr:hypothetical protein [Longimicrobiales bacterium]